MATMKELSADVNTMKIQNEVRKAPMVLMEDNLTKAQRALMVPNIPCPTTRFVQELEAKAQPDAMNRATILKMGETLVKKRSFVKHSQSLAETRRTDKPSVQIFAIMQWITMLKRFQLKMYSLQSTTRLK